MNTNLRDDPFYERLSPREQAIMRKNLESKQQQNFTDQIPAVNKDELDLAFKKASEQIPGQPIKY